MCLAWKPDLNTSKTSLSRGMCVWYWNWRDFPCQLSMACYCPVWLRWYLSGVNHLWWLWLNNWLLLQMERRNLWAEKMAEAWLDGMLRILVSFLPESARNFWHCGQKRENYNKFPYTQMVALLHFSSWTPIGENILDHGSVASVARPSWEACWPLWGSGWLGMLVSHSLKRKMVVEILCLGLGCGSVRWEAWSKKVLIAQNRCQACGTVAGDLNPQVAGDISILFESLDFIWKICCSFGILLQLPILRIVIWLSKLCLEFLLQPHVLQVLFENRAWIS